MGANWWVHFVVMGTMREAQGTKLSLTRLEKPPQEECLQSQLRMNRSWPSKGMWVRMSQNSICDDLEEARAQGTERS